jgi:hypothetical protein
VRTVTEQAGDVFSEPLLWSKAQAFLHQLPEVAKWVFWVVVALVHSPPLPTLLSPGPSEDISLVS